MGVGGNHEMASALPWANHPFILIPFGLILMLVGVSFFRGPRADSETMKDEVNKKDREGVDSVESQLGRLFETGGSGNPEHRLSEQNAELRRLLSDPAKLDGLSADQLEDLRLILEVRLEASERDFTDEEKEFLREINGPQVQFHMSMPIVGDMFKQMLPDTARQKQELIDNLKAVIKLISARQSRFVTVQEKPLSHTVPTKEDERKEMLDEIDSLRSLRNSRREKMKLEGASEEEIRRFENMIDNAIHLREAALQKLLLK